MAWMSKGTSIFFSSQDTVSMFVGYMSSKYSLTWPMFMLTRLKTIRVIEKALYCMHTESRGQQWQRKRSRKWPKDWVKQLVPVIPGPWNWNKRICLRSKVEEKRGREGSSKDREHTLMNIWKMLTHPFLSPMTSDSKKPSSMCTLHIEHLGGNTFLK